MIDLGRASAISNGNNTPLQKDNCRKSIYSSALTIKSSQLNSKFQKLATTLQIICSKDYVTMAPDLYSSSVRTAAERTKLALKKYTKAIHANYTIQVHTLRKEKIIRANEKKTHPVLHSIETNRKNNRTIEYRQHTMASSCLWFTGMEHRNSVGNFPLFWRENADLCIHSNLLVKFLWSLPKRSFLQHFYVFYSCGILMFFLFLCFCIPVSQIEPYFDKNRALLRQNRS
jgi:hypothetical protein